VRLTRPFLHADTAWLKGQVARAEVVDRRALAHLDLTCENQRGEVAATATAVVELPSRDFNVLQPGLVVGS